MFGERGAHNRRRDTVMLKCAPARIHTVAKEYDHEPLCWDDDDRGAGKAGVAKTAGWCSAHEVRSIQHPAQAAGGVQAERVVAYGELRRF